MVTRQDLDAYGTFNQWDALRGVPGVDVSTTRAADGIVSIRGLTKENNNRTLILLNGRRALDGFVESLNWESLPVTLDEIDRIEIVEGPASALYGGNAISGVINIITRQPGQAEGLSVSLTGGSRETGRASALYGHTAGGLEVTASGEFSTSNQFEASHRSANQVVRGRTQIRYDPGDGRVLSFSAGGSDLLHSGEPGRTRKHLRGRLARLCPCRLHPGQSPSAGKLDGRVDSAGKLRHAIRVAPRLRHAGIAGTIPSSCRAPSSSSVPRSVGATSMRPSPPRRTMSGPCSSSTASTGAQPVVERPAGPPPARRDRIFSTGDGGDRGRRA